MSWRRSDRRARGPGLLVGVSGSYFLVVAAYGTELRGVHFWLWRRQGIAHSVAMGKLGLSLQSLSRGRRQKHGIALGR